MTHAQIDAALLTDLVAAIDRRRQEAIFPPDQTDWQAFARESLALDKARSLLAAALRTPKPEGEPE